MQGSARKQRTMVGARKRSARPHSVGRQPYSMQEEAAQKTGLQLSPAAVVVVPGHAQGAGRGERELGHHGVQAVHCRALRGAVLPRLRLPLHLLRASSGRGEGVTYRVNDVNLCTQAGYALLAPACIRAPLRHHAMRNMRAADLQRVVVLSYPARMKGHGLLAALWLVCRDALQQIVLIDPIRSGNAVRSTYSASMQSQLVQMLHRDWIRSLAQSAIYFNAAATTTKIKQQH